MKKIEILKDMQRVIKITSYADIMKPIEIKMFLKADEELSGQERKNLGNWLISYEKLNSNEQEWLIKKLRKIV